MNKKKLIISIFILLVINLLLVGCQAKINKDDYIRLHIRADSNSSDAQEVKLMVRDEIVGYLSAKANSINSKEEMLAFLYDEIPTIEQKANKVLCENGFNYTCKASIRREDFPEKSYGDLTLPEGNYQALILELGRGQGNNWWCVAYPPLCFVASEDADGEKVEYRSIIADFFKNLSGEK